MGKNHEKLLGKRKSVLTRGDNYRGNTSKGYKGEPYWRAHHILPCVAVKTIDAPKDKLPYIDKCLWVTDWNINKPHNMLGLPLKSQYVKSKGKDPKDACCHNVDHPTYNQEVRTHLKKVWNRLQAKKKNHDVDPKCIKKDLEDCTDVFEARLEANGIRNGGTQSSWENRFDDDQEFTWYFPFSMALLPTPRHRGVNYTKMKDLFKRIKIK
jgi:hypothetical protein